MDKTPAGTPSSALTAAPSRAPAWRYGASLAVMAAAAGLKIYTVGIGSESDAARSLFGFQLMNPNADLDERSLRAIADKTGGQYFRARDTEEFHKIYAELDRLEPVEQAAQQWRPQQELFRWPLLAAFVLVLLTAVLRIDPE